MMFAFAALVIHTYVRVSRCVQSTQTPSLLGYSARRTPTPKSTKRLLISTWRLSTEPTKKPKTKFAQGTDAEPCTLIRLLRTDSCCFLRRSVCSSSSLTETTTCGCFTLSTSPCQALTTFTRLTSQYIANKLLELNERGHYVDPATISPSEPTGSKTRLDQDEELFQTARLINCTWFGSCVFSDYFSAILGLVRLGNSWSLNPFGVSRHRPTFAFSGVFF